MSLFSGERLFPGTTVIKPSSPADVCLTVQQVDAGHTGDFSNYSNSSGTVLFKVDKSGKVSVPADGISANGVILPQTFVVTFTADAAASSVAQAFFIADAAYQVTSIKEVHSTASSSGTADVKKCTGTTAPGSGTTMLQSTISTAGAANTVNSGTLSATASDLQLAAGDRLCFVPGGTQTNLVGLLIQATLKRI